jgi:hypothetical protein
LLEYDWCVNCWNTVQNSQSITTSRPSFDSTLITAALLQNDLRTWCSFGFEYQIRLYPQRINYVNRFHILSTFPYNDFTPTFPASICLNADENTPSSVKPKPMILKDSKTLITGRYRFSVKLITIKIIPLR